MYMLWFVSTLAAWSHGVFSIQQTRELSHRWRPIVHPTVPAIVDDDKLKRYTRAMIALQDGTPFGVFSLHEQRISLFIMQQVSEHKHAVQTVLWWEAKDEDFCKLCADQLLVWHVANFPGKDLVVSQSMDDGDKRLIRDGWNGR